MKRTKQIVAISVCLTVAGSVGYAFLLPTGRGPETSPKDLNFRNAPGPPPTRIVSLVPAVTEILFALGASRRLVGRTRWDIYPPSVRTVSDVGDGMRPSIEVVLSVDPDLVLLYDGAGNRNVELQLESMGVRTVSLRHDTLGDLESNIALLGDLVGCPLAAAELRTRVRNGLEEVARATQKKDRLTVYWDAWPEPPITIGRGSFLDSLLRIAGGENVFSDQQVSAPRVSLEAIIYRDPNLILVPMALSTRGIGQVLSERPGWEHVPAVQEGRISVLDQDLVSRLGPRIVDAAWAMAQAIHPDLIRGSSLSIIPIEGRPCDA